MTTMSESSTPGQDRRIQPRRIARLVLPALAIAALYAAWELVPTFVALAWFKLSLAVRQSLVIGSLQGLLIAYVLLLFDLVLACLLVAVETIRSGSGVWRRLWFARLVVLHLSLGVGVACLELTSWAWLRWLHRTPAPAPSTALRPPDVVLRPSSTSEVGASNKPDDPCRVLVIGESSARGEPYQPWLSAGQIVAWQLEKILPHRRVQVDVRAEGGATLEEVQQKLAEITYRPDLLVLFSGHNEFQGRWSWDRNPPYYIDELKPALSAVELALRFSPACRLILETLDVKRAAMIPPRRITRELVDRPTCTDEERAKVLADFRRRVGAIAAYCESLGTVAVFIVPGSNDGDYEPSRSALPPSTEPQARAAFAREFEQVRGTERGEPERAVAGYRSLIERAPGFAESHYRLAKLLEAAGSWAEARDHYIKARECDVMPMRCPEDFRQAYRDVAREHPAVVLVESAEVLGRLSPHGILDDHLYHDAQHPTFRGYLALAEAVLQRLQARGALGWPSGAAAPRIDPDECAGHFQLDKEKWVKVCERSAWFHKVTAYIRHDPAERLERADAYEAAAREIESGQSPERVGIIGLGVHPPALRQPHREAGSQSCR